MEKGRLMMIIIIVLLVVLLGTVVAVSFYVLNMINNQNEALANGTAVITDVKDLKASDLTSVTLGDSFNTDLQPGIDGKRHMLRIRVHFRYDKTDEKLAEEFATFIEANINVARSIALNCITSKTAEDVDNNDDIALLAEEIKDQLKLELDTNLIHDVYFDDKILM
jgi:flagellar basal body-associated protein FliL